MKKGLILLITVVLFTCLVSTAFAASIKITDYPKIVNAGKSVEVKLNWQDIPTANYKLLVQLENWDFKPGVAITKDIPYRKSSGDITVSLDIPANVTLNPASGYRFVAAFVSVAKGWDEVLVSDYTKKDIQIISLLQIINYPTTVYVGQQAEIRLTLENIPVSENYKLIIQLENWDVKPEVFVSSEITEFESTCTITTYLVIPNDVIAAKDCRFVAAYLSKTKGWADVLATAGTKKDVTVKIEAK